MRDNSARRWHSPTARRWLVAISTGALLSACSGDKGDPGASCTAADNGNGTYTLTCGDKTVTVSDGTNGGSCTVTDNGSGTKTITCQDGTTATVTDGTGVDPATLNGIEGQLADLSKAGPESCATCHNGAGAAHQSVYNKYTDASTLKLTITNLTSAADPSCTANTDCVDKTCDNGSVCAGEFGVTMTFTITKNGAPYVDGDGLPSLDQKRFAAVRYDSATKAFLNIVSFGSIKATATAGQYTAKAIAPFSTATASGEAYGYIAAGLLDSGSSYTLYNDVSNAGLVFGTVDYSSAANVSGCEKCHGTPYMKHGYRAAKVAGLPDFAACKACHWDGRAGDHLDWQMLVDVPARYAELTEKAAACAAKGDTSCNSVAKNLTAEETAKYAYTANVMNDVHMAHAMEFEYPQSMANCATCHEGKLDTLLVDANFTRTTCRSCHAITGDATYGTHARSMQGIWEAKGVATSHQVAWLTDENAPACNSCHKLNGGATTRMKDLHNGGYNPMIYADAQGTRYSDIFSASIDTATYDSTAKTLTVTFSATKAAGHDAVTMSADDIVPTIMIGLYGWDSKDYIVSPHSSDAKGNRLLEFPLDGVTTNPRFTINSAANASWSVTADLSQWATMLGDGTVKRAEIAVMPKLAQVVGDVDVSVGTCDPACSHSEHCNSDNACVPNDDVVLALNAPSRTFDFGANAFDDGHFKDIVSVANGCNACHDALATTFHTADRGGNIRVCRMCHVTTSGASHLEMQSRSIDSYVHAIHSFQPFDTGDINFSDPVAKLRYDLQIESTYPNFTLKNCQSCHVQGTYEVPDQSKSMPGILSAADTWSKCTNAADCQRSIPAVDSVVTGPATRACGACHRARPINEDNANELLAFDQHTKTNGYMVKNGTLADGTSVFDKVVNTIMSLFK